jgi:hypothetical protein
MEPIGFGSRAIRDGMLEDACLDEAGATVTVSSVSESTLSFEACSPNPPPYPVIGPHSIPSLLITVSSTTTESESTPTPSSVSLTSSESVSVPSQTPPPPSLLARPVPSRSDGYDYSFLILSPSMHSSVLIPEGAERPFKTSSLRPSSSMSGVPSEEVATVPPRVRSRQSQRLPWN